jgi:nucleoside-diphosphate-sugar epimerase
MITNPSKKILIVGATGFVGPALVDEFSRAGYSVICGVRNLARAAQQLPFTNVELMQVNLNEDLDPALWLDRLKKYQISGVINNVGIANAFGGQSLENVNVYAPLALFQAVCQYCRDNKKEQMHSQDVHVIQISTTGVNWPDCNEYEYPKTKKRIDEALFAIKNLSFTIVRPNIIYEPARGHLLLAQIARLPIIAYVGNAQIQPIHCRELAIGIVRLMEHPKKSRNKILQATGPEVLTWKQVFIKVTQALGRENCILFPVPLLFAKLFTNIIQRLPERYLYRLGILSKMDNDTVEMMTKGSIGTNSTWLKHTELKPVHVYDTYKQLAKSPEAYDAFVESIRTERIDYSHQKNNPQHRDTI